MFQDNVFVNLCNIKPVSQHLVARAALRSFTDYRFVESCHMAKIVHTSPSMREAGHPRCWVKKTRELSWPRTAADPLGADVFRYHWSLLVGPKDETDHSQGTRYHAKETLKSQGQSEWAFEERDCRLAPSNMLLIRVMVAKIEDKARLVGILRSIPVRQGKQGWNCVSWVQEALQRLRADPKALGSSVTDWQTVRDGAMIYCQGKKDKHRFDGRGNFDMRKVATYDLMQRRELTP
jgi:hypothetical protein